jgi:hypothetical protein
VSSTDQALSAMRLSPFDIVISNVWRPDDPDNLKRPLLSCKIHYFDFPDEAQAEKEISKTDVATYGLERSRIIALDQFNKEVNTNSPAGFSLAETIFSSPGNNKTKPDVVLFAAATARVARVVSVCDNQSRRRIAELHC